MVSTLCTLNNRDIWRVIVLSFFLLTLHELTFLHVCLTVAVDVKKGLTVSADPEECIQLGKPGPIVCGDVKQKFSGLLRFSKLFKT